MTSLYDEVRAAVAIRNAAVIAYNTKRTLAGETPTPTQSSTDVLVIIDAQTGAEFRLPISELAADMAGDFASAAQGAKADTALQNAAAFATAAQGATADAAVPKALYNANTVLIATADNTPAPLTIGASTVVGRKASGDIVALTPTESRAILNVEDGATSDMTAAEILTAIKTVDGAASGLDADTLDGLSSADLVGSNGTVNAIVKLTQAAYDALSPPVATTLYVITA